MTAAIEKLVMEVAKELKNKRLMLSTAESCTGGGLGYWLTSVPDSSLWFDRGFVVYSNLAKIELLNVSVNTLQQFGAVSKPTATQMAEGALKNSRAQISVAITGIAGPNSDASNQPIGTVWIAFAKLAQFNQAFLHHFNGDRQTIRLCAIEAALKSLLEFTFLF